MKHYSERAFVERYPLSRKKLLKKMMLSSIYFEVVTLFLTLWVVMVAMGVLKVQLMHWVFMILGIIGIQTVILTINYFYQKRYIETYFYNMTDKLLVIRKGIFAPQEITVPIERIQDVYIDQDVFDRFLDIYDVHISTATATSTIRAHIDGVDKRIAEELRELILNRLHHGPRL